MKSPTSFLLLPALLIISVVSLTASAKDNPTTVQRWHTVTLSFGGPHSSETAEVNPFTDYRLTVTFTHADTRHVIRGFYAADGNAAESGADKGNVWKVRFSPDQVGTWNYRAELRRGTDIAIRDEARDGEARDGEAITLKNSHGTFSVSPVSRDSSKPVRDFRKRGRLIADAGYLRFNDSETRWIKAGSDSPENLLAFADFDGTWRISTEMTEGEATPTEELHRYAAHVRDWKSGDPTWQGGKGKGLIGGLNYLSSVGMNSVYFLTLNIKGDGKDVWPYAKPDDFTRFDCSKLDQWEIVFEHMQQMGIMLHVVTQETENERMLDDGDTGRLRKLYYRELVARFAHHPALIWNLGEENGPADFSPNGQTAKQQKAMASYLKQVDPYDHPVVIHTHASAHGKEEVLPPLLGHTPLDGLSFQVDKRETVNDAVIEWRRRAMESKRPWLIGMDEIGMWHTGVVPDSVDPNHDDLRRHVLWGSLMAGAYGVEWYFGAKFPHNDLTSEDWRQRANMWKQTKIAADFFEAYLPYWQMAPAQNLTNREDTYGFAKPGETYVIYLPKGSLTASPPLKLSLGDAEREFKVNWFDPVKGGDLQTGTAKTVRGDDVPPGRPQAELDRDWVLLIRGE